MYKFSKAIRFPSFKKPYDALFYNLPSVKDRFTTTFGYGKKFDFSKNVLKGKTDSYYDIPREFDLKRKNSPQYSFGKGRDLCIMPEFKIDKDTPGVGTYELRKDLGIVPAVIGGGGYGCHRLIEQIGVVQSSV